MDIYTCPMHPDIRQTMPGKCPKCGMELVLAAQVKPLSRYRAYLPLALVVALSIVFAYIRRVPGATSHVGPMYDVMGAFLLLTSALQIGSLRGFVSMFRQYDLVAKHWPVYAWAYPFLGLAAGYSYIARIGLLQTNIVVTLMFGVGAIGVSNALERKDVIPCACLGKWFTFPLSEVTLYEDLLMALMAIHMLAFVVVK